MAGIGAGGIGRLNLTLVPPLPNVTTRRGRVVYQYRRAGLSTRSLRRRSPVVAIRGMRSTSSPSSGMWLLMFGCGQSVPQITRSGNVSAMWPGERDEVVVLRRPGDGQALGPGQLGPHVLMLAHEALEEREAWTVDRPCHVRPTQVVDDDDRGQGREQVPAPGQVIGFEVDDDVPAELGYAVYQAPVVLVRLGIRQAPDEVEADSAHADVVQVGELGTADARPYRGYAAGPFPASAFPSSAQRVDQGAVCPRRGRSPGR